MEMSWLMPLAQVFGEDQDAFLCPLVPIFPGSTLSIGIALSNQLLQVTDTCLWFSPG